MAHESEGQETKENTPEITCHHPKLAGYEPSIPLQDKAAPPTLLLPWQRLLRQCLDERASFLDLFLLSSSVSATSAASILLHLYLKKLHI